MTWTAAQILDRSDGTNVDGGLDGHMDKGDVSREGELDIDEGIGETVGQRDVTRSVGQQDKLMKDQRYTLG
jgi:hypothetical protein